jgi:hypothetical protein
MNIELLTSKLASVFHETKRMLQEWHIYKFQTDKEIANTFTGAILFRKRDDFPVVMVGPTCSGAIHVSELIKQEGHVVVTASKELFAKKSDINALASVTNGTQVINLEQLNHLSTILYLAKVRETEVPVNIVCLIPSRSTYLKCHALRMYNPSKFVDSLGALVNKKRYDDDQAKFLVELTKVFNELEILELPKVNLFFYCLEKTENLQFYSKYSNSLILN